MQYLVYQMQFESQTPNAMILPLPVALPATEDAVRFVSMEGYGRFFVDLARGFPELAPSRSWFGQLPPAAAMTKDAAVLQVHEVGQFVASFVPTVDDFDRLDPRFVIPRETWAKLPVYRDYGFAVFQLKELAGEPHPMALEFRSRLGNQIFFPTVHIHDGEIHELEEFDHMLYLQDPQLDPLVGAYRGPDRVDPATGWVRSRGAAESFCKVGKTSGFVDPKQLVHRVEMVGRLPNRDRIELVANQTEGIPLASAPARWWWPAGLALGGFAGLSWLIHRRNQMAGAAKGRRQGP